MRFTRRFAVAAVAVGALTLMSVAAGAQSRHKYSVQASVLYSGLTGSAFSNLSSGAGGEIQGRWTPGAWSFGVGYEYTSHTEGGTNIDYSLSGPFFEPRFVFDVGSDLFAPYLSGRTSLLKLEGSGGGVNFSSSGVTLNGGGGVLVSLNQLNISPRLNLDLGATFGYTSFGDFKRTGQGVTTTTPYGSGSNFVLRAGLAFGL